MAKTKGEAPTENKEKAPAKAEDQTRSGVGEEAAPARTEAGTRAKARDEARTRAEQEALAKAEEEAHLRPEEEPQIEAEEEVLAKTEEEAPVEAEQEAHAAADQEIAEFHQLAPTTPAATFLVTSFGTIASETIDYSKKSLANGSALVEKLLGAKSLESAIYVRSEYATTSYADFVAYLTKIGGLYANLAEEALKRRSHSAL